MAHKQEREQAHKQVQKRACKREREWRQVYALAEAVCSTHLAESGAAGRGRLFAETLLPPGGESVAVVVTARL